MKFIFIVIQLILLSSWLNGYVLEAYVNSSSDDVEERLDDHSIYRDSSDLEFVYDEGRAQKVGIRFSSVEIPPDATVTKAYIQFTVDEAYSGQTNLVVVGEASANPSTYTSTAGDVTNRAETTSSVEWSSVPAWPTVDERGVDQRTPSLVDIVNELIGQSGWQSGNAMAFMIKAGADCTDSDCRRTAVSYDKDRYRVPVLHIEFTTPSYTFTKPKANYTFDECVWDGTQSEIKDSSGNGYSGQSVSASTPSTINTSADGVVHRYGDFSTDNTADFVELDPSSIDGLDDFTISLWYKTGSAATGSVQTLFDSQQSGKPQDQDYDMAELRISNNNQIVINLGDQSYYYIDMPSDINLIDNQWHHLVWRRSTDSGNNNCIFVDGKKIECINRTFVSTLGVSYFEMGQEMDGVPSSGGSFDLNQNFEGMIDEVKIYSKALEWREISDIYDNESLSNNYDGTKRVKTICLQAYSDYLFIDRNSATSANVLDNDIGRDISVISNTAPANGTLSGVDADGSYRYTPNGGFLGRDSFTYTIKDIEDNNSTATVFVSVVDSTLVAEYRFDECQFDNANGDDVIDNSLNRLNGSTYPTTDGVAKADSSNIICKGASFDGDDDYIEVADDPKLNITGSMSVSFWVYPQGDAMEQSYVEKYDNSSGWRVWYKKTWSFSTFSITDRIYFDLYIDGTREQVYIEDLENWLNNWHFITAVYKKDARMKLFIRDEVGNKARSRINVSGDITTSSKPLIMGKNYQDKYYFEGKLDEVKIWSRALRRVQVVDIYTNESEKRDWYDDNKTRVCNVCQCNSLANKSMLIGLQSDFRNMSSGKDVLSILGDDFNATYGSDWKLWGRVYDISSSNSARYQALLDTDDLEFGKAYWLVNAMANDVNYSANLKTMDFNDTIRSYPACQSKNGKCILVDLVEPNGTDVGGPYIYTMASLPISKPIYLKDIRVVIDDEVYTPTEAEALGRLYNSTIWRYDQDGKNYTSLAPNTPGIPNTIEPCRGYWIELDKNSAGKDVKLLIPQE